MDLGSPAGDSVGSSEGLRPVCSRRVSSVRSSEAVKGFQVSVQQPIERTEWQSHDFSCRYTPDLP
jgi:hypothetical protein